MKETIYIDTLICVNILINYFVLLSLLKFLNLKAKRRRLILSSAIGSLYSLVILMPPLNFLLSLLLKLVMSITIILLAFGRLYPKLMVKTTVCFYLINFIFAGIIFFIWYFIAPKGIFTKNGMIYFNISPIFFIVSTVVTYLLMKICGILIGQREIKQTFCTVEIKQNETVVKLNAKIDTGNTLREPFSNIPVIVAEYTHIQPIVPQEIISYCFNSDSDKEESFKCPAKLKFRLIPFQTISGNGLLPAFKPNSIKITQNHKIFEKDAFLAVANKKLVGENFSALINADLLE